MGGMWSSADPACRRLVGLRRLDASEQTGIAGSPWRSWRSSNKTCRDRKNVPGPGGNSRAPEAKRPRGVSASEVAGLSGESGSPFWIRPWREIFYGGRGTVAARIGLCPDGPNLRTFRMRRSANSSNSPVNGSRRIRVETMLQFEHPWFFLLLLAQPSSGGSLPHTRSSASPCRFLICNAWPA